MLAFWVHYAQRVRVRARYIVVDFFAFQSHSSGELRQNVTTFLAEAQVFFLQTNIHVIYAWKHTGEARNLTVTKVTDNISSNHSKSSGQPNKTHLLHRN